MFRQLFPKKNTQALRHLFINENTYAKFYENSIILYNQKTKTELQFKREDKTSHDLFKINNSSMLAYVQTEVDDARSPVGETTFIQLDDFKKVAKVGIPLSTKSLILKNKMLIGISGKTMLLYNFETNAYTVLSLQNSILRKLVAISDNAFMVIYLEKTATVHSVIPEELRCHYHFSIDAPNSAIGLNNARFLVQTNNASSFELKLYHQKNNTPEVLKAKVLDAMIEWKNYLFLQDSETILLLMNTGKLFYLSLEDLILHEIDINASQELDDIFMTEKNQILAIFKDGSSFNMSDHLNPQNISDRLYDDLYYPRVLADIIAKYAGISFFHEKNQHENKLFNADLKPKIK